MKRPLVGLILFAILLVTLVQPVNSGMCSSAMPETSHRTEGGLMHQLVASCNPLDLVGWISSFSSFELGRLVVMAFVLVFIYSIIASLIYYFSPPHLSVRVRARRRLRNPFDFLLEFLARGILQPRVYSVLN